jgi:hypothetical protein
MDANNASSDPNLFYILLRPVRQAQGFGGHGQAGSIFAAPCVAVGGEAWPLITEIPTALPYLGYLLFNNPYSRSFAVKHHQSWRG